MLPIDLIAQILQIACSCFREWHTLGLVCREWHHVSQLERVFEPLVLTHLNSISPKSTLFVRNIRLTIELNDNCYQALKQLNIVLKQCLAHLVEITLSLQMQTQDDEFVVTLIYNNDERMFWLCI